MRERLAVGLALLFAPLSLLSCHRVGMSAEVDTLFESKIRPVLLDACFRCHGGQRVSGGLRVDSRAALLKGGDSGKAIVPGDPDGSLLVKALRHAEGVEPMPPSKPLARHQIDAFAAWIRAGAKWPASTPPFRGERHWAFEAVRPVTPPSRPDVTSPVDAFIGQALSRKGYKAQGPADRRTLVRRAAFDLTGLPPTIDEVEAFAADQRPDAYERLVDRLLASPAYGERWGRHWLDVVRYADSAGENSDHPLPHAWRYRNWVITALNRDQPYDDFARDQVAGDLLAGRGPADRTEDRVIATGYLAIARRFGHDIDKDMHLTLEDCIDTLGKSILGLTLGCARCHSHKYDPITAEDYYALYGILASTRFSFPGCEPKQQPRDLVPLVPDAEWERVIKPYQSRLAALDARLKQLEQSANDLPAAVQTAAVLSRGEIRDGGSATFSLDKSLKGGVAVKKGEMLQLSILPLRNHGADTTRIDIEIREAAGGKRHWQLSRDVLDDFLSGNPHAARRDGSGVWCFLDPRKGPALLTEAVRDLTGHRGLHVWRNGELPSVFVNSTTEPIDVWTKLPPRSVFVHPAADGAVAVGWLSPIDGEVQVSGSVADAHPGGPDGVGWTLHHVKTDVAGALGKATSRRKQISGLKRQRAALAASLPVRPVAYAVAEGEARDVPVQLRGDPEKPGKVVPRRWLSLLGGQAVPPKSGSGRLQLAGWLTRPDNPLTARVMVNRVWLNHFGKGLVKTPNDFGTRGQPPTHPELLDWLAADFIRSGWSLKHLHRRILLSQTYQRTSVVTGHDPSVTADPNNDFYWRFDRRRLSAEELRDALLTLGGALDRSPGGPHPFPPESGWNFTQHNPFNTYSDTDRRSVYLMSLRNRRQPFLGLFDGADPNASTPRRQATTVPTQALYFLNDPFFHRQAEGFAARLMTSTDEPSRVRAAFRLALQREPTERDRTQALRFLAAYSAALADVPAADRPRQAWAAYARVLLGSNEFLHQD